MTWATAQCLSSSVRSPSAPSSGCGLLNHLNRDEVWLTQRNADGSAFLRALADVAGESVEQSRALQRSCLDGAFGALPDVRRSQVQQALGLVPSVPGPGPRDGALLLHVAQHAYLTSAEAVRLRRETDGSTGRQD